MARLPAVSIGAIGDGSLAHGARNNAMVAKNQVRSMRDFSAVGAISKSVSTTDAPAI